MKKPDCNGADCATDPGEKPDWALMRRRPYPADLTLRTLVSKYNKIMLPTVIEQLIYSFLLPEPYSTVLVPFFSWSYCKTDDWEDVHDVRCYGDF